MKKKIAVVALLSMLNYGVVASCFAAGSVLQGNVEIYKNGKVADKIAGKGHVEEGSLMVCDGKCMVKSEGITLVGEDQAKFAIQNDDATFNLYLRAGKVNYAINDNTRKIAFHTPDGAYTVADVIFNAESVSVVKGFVSVNAAGETEIAVTEGRLVFATADGMKAVDANNKIVLAVAGAGAGAAAGAGAGAAAGGGAGAVIAAGIVGSAVLVAFVADASSGDSPVAAASSDDFVVAVSSDDPPVVSPSR